MSPQSTILQKSVQATPDRTLGTPCNLEREVQIEYVIVLSTSKPITLSINRESSIVSVHVRQLP